jgi:predicted XRE-type DNA-binding protein
MCSPTWVAEPEEELARAQLASRIQQIIKERRLTQVAAALFMGVDHPSARAIRGETRHEKP